MIDLLRHIVHSVRAWIEIRNFKHRISKRGGIVGKPLNLLNSNRISVGQKVKIKDGFRIECYENFNNKILNPSFIIEDGVIIGPYFTAFVASDLRIGKDTIFAGNVTLITENHGMNPESPIPYHAQPLITGIISIGEGCWLGQNVSVLPNVRIGNKCIIATGSVVNSDIPDYSIAAGIPAKVIKKYNFQNHTWERVLNES